MRLVHVATGYLWFTLLCLIGGTVLFGGASFAIRQPTTFLVVTCSCISFYWLFYQRTVLKYRLAENRYESLILALNNLKVQDIEIDLSKLTMAKRSESAEEFRRALEVEKSIAEGGFVDDVASDSEGRTRDRRRLVAAAMRKRMVRYLRRRNIEWGEKLGEGPYLAWKVADVGARYAKDQIESARVESERWSALQQELIDIEKIVDEVSAGVQAADITKLRITAAQVGLMKKARDVGVAISIDEGGKISLTALPHLPKNS